MGVLGAAYRQVGGTFVGIWGHPYEIGRAWPKGRQGQSVAKSESHWVEKSGFVAGDAT